MRSVFFLFLCLVPGFAVADQVFYPARSGNAGAPVLTVYSSLDEPLAQPMIAGFQDANPDVAVKYEDMSFIVWTIFSQLLQLSLPAGPLEHLFF